MQRNDILKLLFETPYEALRERADEVRAREKGEHVFVRGLIEFSNRCERNCRCLLYTSKFGHSRQTGRGYQLRAGAPLVHHDGERGHKASNGLRIDTFGAGGGHYSPFVRTGGRDVYKRQVGCLSTNSVNGREANSIARTAMMTASIMMESSFTTVSYTHLEQGGEKQRGNHPIRLWAQQDVYKRQNWDCPRNS